MSRPSFFAELKRRNVYKVGAMYAIGGWLLVQVVTQVLPIYETPTWVQRLLVTLIIAGFPVALIISWIYDLTPQGIVRTDAAGPDKTTARRTGRHFNRIFIGMLVVVVLVISARMFWPFGQSNTAFVEANGSASVPNAVTAAENAPNAKSLAVLPFENRSSEKDNAYFAEGIQDEILTRLAKIGALKVISRTSTQRYASSPDNLPLIAKQLGVASILEGSVQKVGDRVRISVQLIEASSDTHLWAETYDRQLTDIFGVESNVATAIAEALQARLSGGEQRELAVRPTRNAEAYDAYLHGLASEVRSWYEPEAFETAAQFFAQAAELDPQFVQAWARLSRVDALLVFSLQDTSAARREASKQALARAVALQPDSTDTQLAQAYYRYWMLRDYPAARLLFEALWSRLPSSSEVPLALSLILRRQGLWDQSLAYSDQAIALDPLNPVLLAFRANTYANTRRYAEAIKMLDRRLEILPGDPETIASQVGIYQVQGRLDQARQLLGRLPSAQASINLAVPAFNQSLLEHSYPQTLELLKALLAKPEFAVGANGAAIRAALGFVQRLSGNIAAAKTTNMQARREFEALREKEPDNADYAGRLGLVYAELGEKMLALKEGERAVTLLPASRDAVQGPAMEENLAAVEAQVGETGRAIDRLQHLLGTNYSGSFSGGPITVELLKLDPTWDPLREDSRFQKLIFEKELK